MDKVLGSHCLIMPLLVFFKYRLDQKKAQRRLDWPLDLPQIWGMGQMQIRVWMQIRTLLVKSWELLEWLCHIQGFQTLTNRSEKGVLKFHRRVVSYHWVWRWWTTICLTSRIFTAESCGCDDLQVNSWPRSEQTYGSVVQNGPATSR